MVLLWEGESVIVLVTLVVGEDVALEIDFGELSVEPELELELELEGI